MKKSLHPFWKVCSFLPALLLMCTIFSFSAQTGEVSSGLSYQVSARLVDTVSSVSGKELSDDDREMWIDRIHTPVRKAAHMSEYCLLALFCFPSSDCLGNPWKKTLSSCPCLLYRLRRNR